MRTAPTSRKAADVSGTHLWLVLMKAHRALERQATQSIESLNVCLSDFGVMELLLHKGPQPVFRRGTRPPPGKVTACSRSESSRGARARTGDHATLRSGRWRLRESGATPNTS